MLALNVSWILFLLVTIYDNQTEILLQSCNYKFQKIKNKSIWATQKGYISEIDSWFLEAEVGQGEGEERGLCLLNSNISTQRAAEPHFCGRELRLQFPSGFHKARELGE